MTVGVAIIDFSAISNNFARRFQMVADENRRLHSLRIDRLFCNNRTVSGLPTMPELSRGGSNRNAERSFSLIPNFDLVAIRVGDVGVGAARTEFAPPEQLATGTLDFLDSRVDVPG